MTGFVKFDQYVAQFGTFDTPNFGDCLFPMIVLQQAKRRQLRTGLLPFSPTSRKPAIGSGGMAFSDVPRLFNESPVHAFMIGGGALLSTEHVLFSYPEIRPRYPYSLKCWLLPAMIAKAWNVPLILNGIGMGPFDPHFNDLARRYLAHAAIPGVRDAITARYFQQLGLSPEIMPDSAMLITELSSAAEWDQLFAVAKRALGLPDKYVAVQASLFLGADLERFAAAVAEGLRGTGVPALLLPICHHLNDRVACEILERIIAESGVRTLVVKKNLHIAHTGAILRNASLFVGTSLHGALVTLAFGKPAVSFSLSHMKKNRSVLDVFGAANCCTSEIAEVPDKIATALAAGGNPYADDFDRARRQVGSFFDRVCEVVSAAEAIHHKPQVSMVRGEVFCEPIQDDLNEVRRLSAEYLRSISLARRVGAVAIRNNAAASRMYDRAMHRIALRRGNRKQ